MKICILALCWLLLPLYPLPAAAQDPQVPTPTELREAMLSAIASIEEALGRPPAVSEALAAADEELVEMTLAQLTDKEAFLAAAREIVERIESARPATAGRRRSGGPGAGSLVATLPNMLGAPLFPPAYPSDDNTAEAMSLGLITSNDDRCDLSGLSDYQQFFADAEEALAIADSACTVAGCDPSGFFCAGVCVGVEGFKFAALVARRPLDACEAHDAAVDSAEIEAGFENGKSNHANLEEHDGNLAIHDQDIKAALAGIQGGIADIREGQIEEALADCEPIVRLMLPEAFNGHAETVIALVDVLIDDARMAGAEAEEVAKAESRLARGIAEFERGNYDEAYERFCSAYRKLDEFEGDDDDDDDDDD